MAIKEDISVLSIQLAQASDQVKNVIPHPGSLFQDGAGINSDSHFLPTMNMS